MAGKIIDLLLEKAEAENPEQLRRAESDLPIVYALGMRDYEALKTLVPLMKADGVTEEHIIENAFFAGFMSAMHKFGEQDAES